jgi:4-hydroxybenzoate polyprenyltransferase
MKLPVTLGDQAINDLALLAAIVAFSAVLVVAALWAAAAMRIDRAVEVASIRLGHRTKQVIAAVMCLGTVALFTLPLPAWIALNPWLAGAAGCWVAASMVALAAAGRSRPKQVASAEVAPPLSKAA